MDRQRVQDWLDGYVEAWKTYDPEKIGSLFSEDVVYRYHPYDQGDDVVHGREAIVKDWLEPDGNASGRDQPGTFEAHYEPWIVDGNRAVAVGSSRYWTDASRTTVRETYDNAYLLEFDPEGRCCAFTEFFLKRPKA